MMMIIFTAYKILMLQEPFTFFEFQDLSFEFCGGFVAIGRRRHGTSTSMGIFKVTNNKFTSNTNDRFPAVPKVVNGMAAW